MHPQHWKALVWFSSLTIFCESQFAMAAEYLKVRMMATCTTQWICWMWYMCLVRCLIMSSVSWHSHVQKSSRQSLWGASPRYFVGSHGITVLGLLLPGWRIIEFRGREDISVCSRSLWHLFAHSKVAWGTFVKQTGILNGPIGPVYTAFHHIPFSENEPTAGCNPNVICPQQTCEQR